MLLSFELRSAVRIRSIFFWTVSTWGIITSCLPSEWQLGLFLCFSINKREELPQFSLFCVTELYEF